jgi:hypothetical protein
MERQKFSYLAVVAIAILAALTSCDKDKSGGVGGFSVQGNLNQTVYADQTEGKSLKLSVTGDVKTSCEWISIIEPIGSTSWISIDPESGDASKECTINIKLETNTTGLDRLALITISLPYLWETGDARILITVLQKATTEDGKLHKIANPDDDVPEMSCSCESAGYQPDSSGIQLLTSIEAYLFKDSIPRQMFSDFHRNTSDFICWIIINGALGYDWIYFNSSHDYRLRGDGRICNFPDLAKEIDVAETGCKVYIEGLMYPSCRFALGDHISFDFVLSKLRRIDE